MTMMLMTTINSINVNPRCRSRFRMATIYQVLYFVPSNPVPSDLV